jgi:hypothetical protein
MNRRDMAGVALELGISTRCVEGHLRMLRLVHQAQSTRDLWPLLADANDEGPSGTDRSCRARSNA